MSIFGGLLENLRDQLQKFVQEVYDNKNQQEVDLINSCLNEIEKNNRAQFSRLQDDSIKDLARGLVGNYLRGEISKYSNYDFEISEDVLREYEKDTAKWSVSRKLISLLWPGM